MNKLITEKLIVNTAIAIVLASFLFMESGCAYYKVTTKVDLAPQTIIPELLMDLFSEKSMVFQYFLFSL